MIVGGVPLLDLGVSGLELAPFPDILRPVKSEVVVLTLRWYARLELLLIEGLG